MGLRKKSTDTVSYLVNKLEENSFYPVIARNYKNYPDFNHDLDLFVKGNIENIIPIFYLVAKKHCGLKENQETNLGTFTNFAQNDQALYALHTYMMYLKFGFGRATQDAGIEIRRGAMTRSQGVNLVRLYDNNYPKKFIQIYLDYYQISKNEFDKIIDKWANKKLFKKVRNIWQPKFEVK